MIQKGHNAKNWADDVVFGENCLAISFCQQLIMTSGKIILPVSRCPKGFDKLPDPFCAPTESGCFCGTWNNGKIEWELGELVNISPEFSSRGLCEPAIEELKDGRLLMIMRASNTRSSGITGRKWYSISNDEGLSWSKAQTLKYASEEDFYSPASGSVLIRSSLNNKLYWIGNICPDNPNGNNPRYPLVISEVDEQEHALKKESVFKIEDKQAEDSPLVQFSNFRVYEDMETKEVVLTMARILEKGEEDRNEPAYEYRIALH